MKIHSVSIKNYRPFATLEEMRLGPMATIVGKNDVGKSNILRALQVFFDNLKITSKDVHYGASKEEEVIIEVAFTALPEKVELESGVETTLKDEMLLDEEGYLRICKTYPQNDLSKPNITLVTHDYKEVRFAGLPSINEKELNKLCEINSIDYKKSGRGITNKSKREALRNKANEESISFGKHDISLTTKSDLWKKISSLLPEFELFEVDYKLGVGETTFQNKFNPIIKTAAEQPDAIEAREKFTGAIGKALQSEVDKIFERLKRHTDAFVGLKAKTVFSWDKAVTFDILGKDSHEIEISLDERGSGMRRLLMVAFFQYLAENSRGSDNDVIYSIEEPENCLHPSLQRELISSLRELSNEGHQIIVTSHSPVFASASPKHDLALVVREAGIARAIQTPDLDLSDVAEQLGVEPSDQITGYNACVFVEGIDDIGFFTTLANKLKEAKHIDSNFEDKGIGFVICGGDNIKHWITRRAMGKLNRRFGVIVDSDKKSESHNIPQRKLNWKTECEDQGGIFIILRKREIENYLHVDAIVRSGKTKHECNCYTDMKDLYGEKCYKIIEGMTCEEILEMDEYDSNGNECHELLDIVNDLLNLVE